MCIKWLHAMVSQRRRMLLLHRTLPCTTCLSRSAQSQGLLQTVNIVRRKEAAWQLLQDFGRPALHARTLGFRHPELDKHVDFDSVLPADFQRLLEGLRTLPLGT
jgi:hypothetical protein